MMRIIAFVLFVGFFMISCSTSIHGVASNKNKETTVSVDTIRIENKDLDYEVIITEIGFDSWLATQPSSSFYIQPSLENKNKFYVMEWNRRVMLPLVYNPNLYMQQIDYDHQIDYGMQVNYLLYMYFEFFQDKYNQRLF